MSKSRKTIVQSLYHKEVDLIKDIFEINVKFFLFFTEFFIKF